MDMYEEPYMDNPSLAIVQTLLEEALEQRTDDTLSDDGFQALYQVQYHLLQILNRGMLFDDEAETVQYWIDRLKTARQHGKTVTQLDVFRERKEL